jgi:hypothetical protein
MLRSLPILLAGWIVGSPALRADAASPVPLPTLPPEYSQYEIDPDTVSPDGQFGVMYLRTVEDDATTEWDNYVVALNPFRIVVQLPEKQGFFGNKNNCSLFACWAANSSAVVVIERAKWGAYEAFVVPIANGQAGPVNEILGEVRKQLEADLAQVDHEGGSSDLDFTFMDGDNMPINDRGQVIVSIDGATNPKEIGGEKSWVGHFQGLWDIAQGKFVFASVKRKFSGVYQDQQ